MTSAVRPPSGVLIDYGETLVEELAYDPRPGAELLLSRASARPSGVTVDAIVERANRVTREVTARRTVTHVETPWPSLTRLIYDYFGVEFSEPLEELELEFWKATVTTRVMPGALDALDALHARGLPMAVVSNASFGAHVIRYELAKYDLARHLAFVMVSSDYVVRKPNPLLLETAAARLGAPPCDVWMIGDSLDMDVGGARAAGMTSVWFRGDTTASESADLVVNGWPEVVRAVNSVR